MKRLAVLAMMAFFVAAPSAFAVRDFSGTARNIIPSGQYGAVPPPAKADQQARMYDGLTPLFATCARATSPATSSPRSSASRARGRCGASACRIKGVRIFRDKFNVPHIYGKTNDDVTWGAGLGVAQDRELLLEQARYNSRVAVDRRAGPERDRARRGPEELQAERADRARARQGGHDPQAPVRQARPAADPRHARVRQGDQRLLPQGARPHRRPKPWTQSAT